MNIQISNEALSWFKNEYDVSEGRCFFRFFARYGGNSSIQSGFSLGVTQEQPNRIGVKVEVEGLIFFIEESDLWYFEGYDLEVNYNDDWDEIQFNYLKR